MADEEDPKVTLAPRGGKRFGAGRRTKLTPDMVDVIAKKLNRENDLAQLAAVVGVHPASLRNWLKRGAAGEEPYTDLYQAVMVEQSQYIEELVTQGDTYSALGNTAGVRWVQFKLQKCFRSWGEKMPDETGQDDGTDYASLSTDELAERARRLLGVDAIDTRGRDESD